MIRANLMAGGSSEVELAYSTVNALTHTFDKDYAKVVLFVTGRSSAGNLSGNYAATLNGTAVQHSANYNDPSMTANAFVFENVKANDVIALTRPSGTMLVDIQIAYGIN